MDKAPWAMSAAEVLKALKTRTEGLTVSEVEKRTTQYGLNAFPEPPSKGLIESLKDAFSDKMTRLLLVCAVISAVIGVTLSEIDPLIQAVLIVAIVVFMVLVAWFQDRKADDSMQKLKQSLMLNTAVIRDGADLEITTNRIVPGDIIRLKAGDKVPADARVLTSERGEVLEAILTGEPNPVSKHNNVVLKADIALAIRENMVFSGTDVVNGTITAVVVSTGLSTEFGKIRDLLTATESEETPLQGQLNNLADNLAKWTLIVCSIVALIYLARDFAVFVSLFNALKTSTGVLKAATDTVLALAATAIIAVSLAIAFIPEALPAVITMALAFASGEMEKEGALVRKMRAAEGLGSVTDICTDKTGTVTEGQMTVTNVFTLKHGSQKVADVLKMTGEPEVHRILDVARICTNLQSATEEAIANLARLAGFEVFATNDERRLKEAPFDSARKRMSILFKLDGQTSLYSKGAPERIIERCIYALNGDKTITLTDEMRQSISKAIEGYQLQGMRCLAFADRIIRHHNGEELETFENDLTFIGIVVLSDPIRPEVPETVRLLNGAGITPRMITGDSRPVAWAIAREAGILSVNATIEAVLLCEALNGLDPEDLSTMPQALKDRVVRTVAFARAEPVHKILIVNVLKEAGRLVAMTGDGVNDAPSLKAAHVGIAMANGTDITKEVADVVLTKTYSAIASAVKIGRTVYNRTRLYAHALLSTNAVEVGYFVVSAVAGWLAPWTAVQLLWINVLGDSWLSMALATEKPESDVMKQKPQDPNEKFINKYMMTSITIQLVVVSLMLSIGHLLVLWLTPAKTSTTPYFYGMAMLMFMVQKIARSSFTARSMKRSIVEIGFFSNPLTIYAALLTTALTAIAFAIPYFGLAMTPTLFVWCLILGVIPALVEEVYKHLLNKK